MTDLKGIVPAIVTPLTEDNQVDEGALRELVGFLLEKGVHGFFPAGTAGEGVQFSLEERKQIFRVVMEETKGQVPVLAHTGCLTTKETVELNKYARDLGVEAVSVVTPFYYKLTEQELIDYYTDLASQTPDLAIFIYNIPQYTGNPVPLRVFAELSQVDNIVGAKDSQGDKELLQGLCSLNKQAGFQVFVGADRLDQFALEEGASGVVTSLGGIFPEPYLALYEAVQTNNLEQASKAQARINTLCDIFQNSTRMSLLKNGVFLRGIEVGKPRPPLSPGSREERHQLRHQLEEAGFLK